MKTFSWLKLTAIAVAVTIVANVGVVESSTPPTPVSNVQVTLKGKKYQIDDVTTVAELQERLEEQSGISPSKQGKILHQGKRLNSASSSTVLHLSEAGVSEGDQLNCVPAKKKSSTSTKKKSSSPLTTSAAAATPAAAASGGGGDTSIADMMKGLGLGGGEGSDVAGPGGLDDMIQKMMSGAGGGGAGGAEGGMPDMKESMAMLKELTNSPLFSEYMNDPEKLEESRQMILQNPMMKTMMSTMPGMGELLKDKDTWAQTMIAAGQMMKSMDSDDMIKMMEAQAGAMGGGMPGGMPPGMGGMGSMGADLFGDNPTLESSSALDELSEGED